MKDRTPCQELEVLSCCPGPDPSLVDLTLSAPGWTCKPGQFVMLRPEDWGLELVWPRPFSICDVSESGLRIMFQTVGRGTRKLASLRPGQRVTVWGPLGQWFRLDPARPTLILAGGIGIAPFVFLARTAPSANLSLLFGHRLALEAYPFAEIAAYIPSQAMQQTSGADIAAFEQVLAKRVQALAGKGQVIACGPEPMLKVVRKYCLLHGTDGQISLENRMSCGVGACLGCVAKTTNGDYVQSCVHGPVFHVRDIELGD
ncbi:dihydroorotate dehydrogenase electron transfer subunit [Desulfovibrionales bacterium]